MAISQLNQALEAIGWTRSLVAALSPDPRRPKFRLSFINDTNFCCRLHDPGNIEAVC
jgi:hypothetical protein